jgi:hypothetical protein
LVKRLRRMGGVATSDVSTEGFTFNSIVLEIAADSKTFAVASTAAMIAVA